ncbi:kinase-like protein, partial [Rhizoctonia solani]
MPQSQAPGSRRNVILHDRHEGAVNSVVFSPDGNSVVSGSHDSTIRIWDAQSTFSRGDPIKGHIWPWGVKSVSYSPLGDMIASGSGDSTVRLWDPNTGQQINQPFKGHEDGVASVAFSPDANLIVSGSNDTTVQLWNLKGGKSPGPFTGHTDWVNTVTFSHDGTRIVSGSGDRTIRVWDIERGEAMTIDGHTWGVNSVALSPDDTQILSGSHDGTASLWDIRSGKMIGNPYKGHNWWVSSVAFSPDGLRFVSGSGDSTVRVWDTRRGDLITEPFEEHTSWVYAVAFSPCGTRIASGSNDNAVMIWDIENSSDSDDDDGSTIALEDDKDSSVLGSDNSGKVTRNMTMKDMFDRLLDHGCIDLSTRMDIRQDNARILTGGSFGDVWKGELYSGNKVAIKAWRSSEIDNHDYKTLKRATREIFYWSRMKHDNIHQLMGIIIFKGAFLGMVSEWMDNGNLREYILRNPRVDRYQMAIQVASGLAYMHSSQAIHGDLKAMNVLVSSEGVAKLSDFDFSIMSGVSLAFSGSSSNNQPGSTRWAVRQDLHIFLQPPNPPSLGTRATVGNPFQEEQAERRIRPWNDNTCEVNP